MGKSVVVLGYFGRYTNKLDGQTVKTRSVSMLLQNKLDDFKIYEFDTESVKFNKLNVFRLFYLFFKVDKVVYLPAHGNLKFAFPFLFLFSKLFFFKIHYFVIGGWLPEFLKKLPFHVFLLRRITCIYPETELMFQQLAKQFKFKNIIVASNFRFIKVCEKIKDYNSHKQSKVKLVFYSRINKMKGIEVIFKLAEYIYKNKLAHKIIIDFYGPVLYPDKEYFFENICKFDFVQYKGVLDPEQVVCTLKSFDLLLFPTKYFTEGLPGAIIDGYIAGLPVIATNWKHANEFIINNNSGLICPWNDDDYFIETVMRVCDEPNLLQKLKDGAFLQARRFDADIVWETIKDTF